MRTTDVARESGYSAQQVRDLERLGVIPPAVRSDNGYRSYTPLHVSALRAYRGLAAAAEPVEARRLLAELRTATVTEAASAVDEVHARLARERAEVLRAQRALEGIQAEGAGWDDDFMTITQLAQALGVRSSTLRFWEEEGLVLPERVTTLRARRYGPAAIRAARVVVALRAGGYGIPAVREVMACLDGADGLADARRILRERLDRIAARSVALLRAGADLAAVVCAADGTDGTDAADATRGTPDPPA
ncbi:MerR family transcriptional regulator [Streptomyces canus]|uniref:MerR family transcriptional regulator n=1 Tax=Streptomyces canus TaxID=58343 RepID=UPI00036F57A0|nr:MerR family transcriptional regulator [Streptomyces canus]